MQGASADASDVGLPHSPSSLRPSAMQIVAAASFAGVAAAVAAGLGFGLSRLVSAAVGLDGAILIGLALATRRERLVLRLEEQLAQLLRLSAASLRAGLGRVDSLAQATRQVGAPLAAVVGEAVGRLRLGEDAAQAFATLARRVPLESFRLFSVVIAAQWHAGGSLQHTLGSIGESLQDRVEVGRRIQTQAAPTRSSVLTLAAACAAIAYFSHANDPENLGRFLRSDWGERLVALSLVLQGASLLWIWRLTRTRL